MNQTNDKNKEPDKQNKKAETGENYGFIKEERVPLGKWQKKKKIFRNIFLVLSVAVLFGVIARCSYGISDYVIKHFFTKEDTKEPVNLRPSPTFSVEPGGTDPVILDEKAFQSFESIIKGVQTAAEALDPSLVTVSYVKQVVDPVFKDVTESLTNYSGVIIAANGSEYLIYTPYSGMEESKFDNILVTFFGGKRVDATVYAYMKEADMLLLAVKLKDLQQYEREKLRVITLGKSSELSLGSAVIALGFPDGHGSSANMGFITSRSRKEYITDLSLEILETNILGARGESGILINTKGQLVGFLTNRFRENGSCIEAISLDKVYLLLNFLVNHQNDYPKFGARFRDIDDEVLSRLSIQNGIIIEEVAEHSAADSVFRQGDILYQINEQPITSVEEFFSYYTGYDKDEEVTIWFYRNGKEMKRDVKISY